MVNTGIMMVGRTYREARNAVNEGENRSGRVDTTFTTMKSGNLFSSEGHLVG